MPEQPRDRGEIPQKLRDAVQACAMGEEPWPLFVYGITGTGKSCAGLCAIDYYGGWYLTVTKLCRALNLALQRGGERNGVTDYSTIPTVEEIWAGVRLSHLVVLDELGKRLDPTSPEKLAIEEVLDNRKNKPLLAISNHNLPTLKGILGTRTVSRLSGGTRVELTGPDRRLGRKN